MGLLGILPILQHHSATVEDIHQQCNELYPVAYGRALYAAVRLVKPRRIIEFGPGHGFTTLCLARGALDSGEGRVLSYDLWDARPRDVFQQKTRHRFRQNLRRHRRLKTLIDARSMDFWQWLKQPEPFDVLYLDINNDGDIIARAVQALQPQLEAGAVLLFEGGLAERDRLPKYEHRPGISTLKTEIHYQLLCEEMPGLGAIAPGIDWPALGA